MFKRNFKDSYGSKKSQYHGMSGKKVREDWSWGKPVEDVIEIDDDDLPDEIVECGRFAEAHFWPIKGRTGRQNKIIKLPESQANNSYLGFDFKHPFQRLYIILDPKFRKKMKKEYWDKSNAHIFNPADIAEAAGGKHATEDYPDIDVKPIGILRNVVYATDKGNDNFSLYIHAMGEETGIRPALCVDETGRLWIVGGDYTCPIPGITN